MSAIVPCLENSCQRSQVVIAFGTLERVTVTSGQLRHSSGVLSASLGPGGAKGSRTVPSWMFVRGLTLTLFCAGRTAKPSSWRCAEDLLRGPRLPGGYDMLS